MKLKKSIQLCSISVLIMTIGIIGSFDFNNEVSATQPGTNGKIVYVSQDAGAGTDDEIFISDADGSNEVQLTFNTLRDNHPRISPDGTKIAFHRNISSGPTVIQIIVMDIDGSNEAQLTTFAGIDASPCWSPTGTQIAWGSESGTTGRDVWIMDYPGGGSKTQVTTEPGFDGVCNWSSTNRIAFESFRISSQSDIYDILPTGLDTRRLTNDLNSDNNANWSPDGQEISFCSTRDTLVFNQPQIYKMDKDGDSVSVTRLTTGGNFDCFQVYSPDQSLILFGRGFSNNDSIFSMSSTTGEAGGLTFITNGDANQPDWQNAGPEINGKIVYVRQDLGAGTDDEIFISDNDGSNEVQLTFNTSHDRAPKFSPDGTKIAFSRFIGSGASHVYVMDIDGMNEQQLTTFGGADIDPCWSPDGTQIAWTSLSSGNADIWKMDYPGGGNKIQLTTSTAIDASCDWGVNDRIVYENYRFLTALIFDMKSDGTDERQLTTFASQQVTNNEPSWSPDAQEISFCSTRDTAIGDNSFRQMYKMDKYGEIFSITRLTFVVTDFDCFGVWSPDGNKIMFGRGIGTADSIYTMSSVDGEATTAAQLVTGPDANSPDWEVLGPEITIDDFEVPASGSSCNTTLILLPGSSIGTDSSVSGVLGNERDCSATLQTQNPPSEFEIIIIGGEYRSQEGFFVDGKSTVTYGAITDLDTDFSGQDSIDLRFEVVDFAVDVTITLESGSGAQVGTLTMTPPFPSATTQTVRFQLSSFSGSLDFTDIDKITIEFDSQSGGQTDFAISLIDTTVSIAPPSSPTTKTCDGFVGLWTDPAAWSPSGQPTPSEPVSMINGCDLTIGSTESIAADNTVDIDASSTLTVGGNFHVFSGGPVNNSGNFVVINGGTTTVIGGTFNNLSSNSVNIFGFFIAKNAILDNSGDWVNEATGNMELQGTTTFTTQQGASFTAVVGSFFYMIDTSSYTNLGLTEIFSHMNALVGTSINNGVAGPDDADFIVRDGGVLKVGGTLTNNERLETTPLATLVILTTGVFNNNDIFANQGFTNLLFTGTYNEAGTLQFEPVFSTQEKIPGLFPWVQISPNLNGGPPLASPDDDFGLSSAVIGDIDNDGVEDLAVSAIGDATGGGFRNGAVYILFMKTDSTAKGFTKLANELNGMPIIPDLSDCGRAVAGLGDVDGDTIPDIAIGCDSWGLGGAVLFVMLNADGTAKAVTIVEHQSNGGPTLAAVDLFGTAVTSVGDIDSDGKTNIVIGARGDNTGGANAGAIYTAEVASTGVISEVIKIANGLGGMPAGTLRAGDLFGRGIGAVFGSVPNLFVSADGRSTFCFACGSLFELDMELNAGVWELASVQEYIPPQGIWPGISPQDEINFPNIPDVGGDNFLFDFDSDGTPDFTASAAGGDDSILDNPACGIPGGPCLDCGGAYIIITGGDARPIEVIPIPAPIDACPSEGWFFSMAIGSDFNDDGLGEIIGGSTEHPAFFGPGGEDSFGAIRIFHYQHIIDTPASDSDGDGVPNNMDQCPGFDDALDADSDVIPDGCDPNTEITTNTVAVDTTFGGDLTVSASFTVPSGITVEFDFVNNKILVISPSGKILIEFGGKIT